MRTLIIGFDAFDARLFERLHNQGKLPNLGKYAASQGYARLSIANPAQSEVSWTSIATGLNPGGHGLFDFVHRNPSNYGLNVSLLPTKRSAVGTQFVPPHQAHTLFEQAVQDGYPATSLWWPATFPARLESPVQTIPGLGTPDIFGRLGVGFFFTEDTASEKGNDRKTQIERLEKTGSNEYKGKLPGPAGKTLTGMRETVLEFTLTAQEEGARLEIGKGTVILRQGVWSPIFQVSFKVGLGVSVHGLTRAILTQSHPSPKLYLLPLQLHPLHTPWRYATPGGFIKKVWQGAGPFLTLGWPQDTTGLEEGVITDAQFLALCDLVAQEREAVLMQQLGSFEEGVLACVFDTLDRVQHMFWHDRQDVIEAWYAKLDSLLGRVKAQIQLDSTNLIILSDHGFANFEHKVHLNSWLVDNAYLTPKEPGHGGNLKSVDWSKTQAYALGLNSLYLNLAGRESQGVVNAEEKAAVANQVRERLTQWKGPDGSRVMQQVWTQEEAFEGPLAGYGPDLVLGYSPGYRASAENGLGEWAQESLEVNRDHWGADHCIAPEAVPGVLFCSQGLANLPNPSYRDIPALALGKPLESGGSTTAPTYSDESEEVVEQRLKDLGYL